MTWLQQNGKFLRQRKVSLFVLNSLHVVSVYPVLGLCAFIMLFFAGIQETEERQDCGMWMMNNLGLGTRSYGNEHGYGRANDELKMLCLFLRQKLVSR